MKPLVICLLLVTFEGALGAPETGYLEVRDRYIDAFNQAPDAVDPKAEARALAEVAKRLEADIPPFKAEGFKRTGQSNLETLVKEEGFGKLDGLVYTAPKSGARVIVTSKPLLAAWLSGKSDLPQGFEAALKADDFYTQAISTDAAVARFAALPVTTPPDARFVYAMLDLRRQDDISAAMPNEIMGAVVAGDRIFVFSQKLATTIKDPPVCAEVWRKSQAKADAAYAVYQAGGAKDEKAFDASQTMRTDGEVAHRKCFADHLSEQPFFKSVLGQTQALIDQLR